jgi:hypothetical protein
MPAFSGSLWKLPQEVADRARDRADHGMERAEETA